MSRTASSASSRASRPRFTESSRQRQKRQQRHAVAVDTVVTAGRRDVAEIEIDQVRRFRRRQLQYQ